MPLLASASAQAQGKTLVEVCTVYGVSLVPLQGPHEQLPDHNGAHHGSEHCALTALAALAAPAPAVLALAAAPAHAGDAQRAHAPPRVPDACATWVARLQHGPPAFA